MKVLLDTCTLLWVATDDTRLSNLAREIVTGGRHSLFLSVASVWEIAVKFAQSRLILPEPPAAFVRNCRALYGLHSLPLLEPAALHVTQIPRHHSDPFDRMLICQSLVHGLTILSPDRLLEQYPVRMIW